MKKNIKLTSLIMNVIAIVVTSAILIGSTFAWFTDSVTSSGNKIQAGTLKVDLELLDKDGTWNSIKKDSNPIFDYDMWEPGYTDVKILKVENEGSLALQWKAKFILGKNLSELANAIEVYVCPSLTELTYPDDRSLVGYERVGTVADFVKTIESTTKGNLAGGDKAYLGIALKMPTSAGNEYQGLDIGGTFDIQIVASQLTAEEDGFGSDYDDGALYPITASTSDGLKTAMLERGGYITLTSDIVIDSTTPAQYGTYMFIANGREVTIDLNGHDIVVDSSVPAKISALFTTANGGTLNVCGDGEVRVENGTMGVFRAMNKNDQINIYGGTFVSNSNNDSNALCIIYTNSGNVDVYGGAFRPLDGIPCANAEDIQGNRLSVVFHEGVYLKHTIYYTGYDAPRIQLEQGCTLKEVDINGETWYKVSLADK